MKPPKKRTTCNPKLEFMFVPLAAIFVCCYVYYLVTKVPHESLAYRVKSNLGSSEHSKPFVRIQLKTNPTFCLATCSKGVISEEAAAEGLCLGACDSSTSATRWYWSNNAYLVSIGHKCLSISNSDKTQITTSSCSNSSAIMWVYHELMLTVRTSRAHIRHARGVNAQCLTAKEFGLGEAVNLVACEEDHDALQSWAFIPDA